ncbi:M20/M25/M40 family metallo-hydrolase [Amycolatopsis jejuensis]|uniref:M20/M25/M40 family metallo-hydrolase n=1 Tax=Amycolatopsis jejuensis TaxID=330084 RepID=UPI00054F5B9D|nr:M20/M25/M40 family metallo-hydrolase [Amycolatopsis jejuensis]
MTFDLTAALKRLATQETDDRRRLAELVAIESVSSDPGAAEAIECAVEWTADELRRLHFTEVRIHQTPTKPALTAKLVSPIPDAPTVLVYGHVDVQPAEPLAPWTSPPFEVTERDGALYGRGVTDDKGQLLMYLRAIEAVQASGGQLPVTVLVVVDAEEEVGSPSLATVLAEVLSPEADLGDAGLAGQGLGEPGQAEPETGVSRLAKSGLAEPGRGEPGRGEPGLAEPGPGKVAVALVSDSPMLGVNQPAIGRSLRGLTYVEVTVTALAGDVHSGQFGGAVPNSAAVLAHLVAGLHDDEGRVTVPGFYDGVDDLTAADRAELAALPIDQTTWLAPTGARCGCGEVGASAPTGARCGCGEVGASAPTGACCGCGEVPTGARWTCGEAGYPMLERTWTRPTLEVNGLVAGHTGPGPKTIVPAGATAKLSMRLVGSQDPDAAGAAVVAALHSAAPPSVELRAEYGVSSRPVETPVDTAATEAALEALAETWQTKPSVIRDGGTIPAVAVLQLDFGLPTLLLGFGVPDENKHAPNEWLPIDHFRRGPEALIRLWPKLAAALRP